MKKALFLDRDGVVNEAIMRGKQPTPPRCWDEFKISVGFDLLYNCAIKMDYSLFVITNQPDIVRGKTSKAFVDAINTAIQMEFPSICEIVVCPHDTYHNCKCRKPRPGMIFYLQEKYDLNLDISILIGDRLSDIQCGKSAGCKTIFVNNKYEETKERPNSDFVISNLYGALSLI